MKVIDYLKENYLKEYELVVHEAGSIRLIEDYEEDRRNEILNSDIDKYDDYSIDYTSYGSGMRDMAHIYTNCLHKILW